MRGLRLTCTNALHGSCSGISKSDTLVSIGNEPDVGCIRESVGVGGGLCMTQSVVLQVSFIVAAHHISEPHINRATA